MRSAIIVTFNLFILFMAPSYSVLAYYAFVPVADPHHEVLEQRAFLERCDATARIYLSEDGINGQLSIATADGEKYMSWLQQRPPFTDITFRLQSYHEHVFPRLTVKYRKQLVALDATVDMTMRAPHLSPKEWRRHLEGDEEFLLLDVRNEYECAVGHFRGAVTPPCETFRAFTDYAVSLKEKLPSDKKILMCCTGGIRCELYSSLLVQHGFKQVYQLDGGIINYGLQEGSSHWLGKLFVFDDRLTVPISDEPTETVGRCHRCDTPSESYYNCANMDCNELFLACTGCLAHYKGSCSDSCQQSERLRPYHQQHPHKPFRRWHHYFPNKR